MRIFLAGIMQGSRQSESLHSQDYRQRLTQLLHQYLPEAEVYDPFANHPTSLHYSDEEGKRVFLGHNELCGQMDVIIAFLPEASMGTAIEMWEAWQNGVAVIAITPLTTNWVVRFLTHRVYSTLEEFENAARNGEVAELIQKVRNTP